MEKLIKPAEYAKEVGISRQAVYAKIKRGILTTKNVEGKLYIVLHEDSQISKEEPTKAIISKTNMVARDMSILQKQKNEQEYKRLLAAKDETIQVLKGTMKELKKSNKQMSSTLRGEIELLKQAFYEMRTLYTHKIEQMKTKPLLQKEMTEISSVSTERFEKWIGIKKFLKRQNIIKEKEKQRIRKYLKKAYKEGDRRLVKIEGKLKIDSDKKYEDIL
ncbi:MAG TPA: hypothetical protein CFH81_07090 [Sulfurovum sp. UBA12169]|nr:MAG TPA: hypothetical protein CFH81_07090 [Sulfurovum sp. UBA12169]